MTSPRDVKTVTKEILNVIPETELGFKTDAHNLVIEFSYKTPETMFCRGWSKIEIIIYFAQNYQQ